MTAAEALVWAAVGVWGSLGVYTSVTDLREGIIPGRWVWRAGFAMAALPTLGSLPAPLTFQQNQVN